MKIAAKVIACLATVSWIGLCGLVPQTTLAQSATEPAGPSYNERWRVFKPGGGTKQVDPNVYVYTPEFAKRFQMPEEWISTELKGVDAVAFRVVPSYSSCGWGGDPKACNTNEVSCEMDLYFDHKINPLPWDARYPEVVADQNRSSSYFVSPSSRWNRMPKRTNDDSFATHSPFVDPKSGKGMLWKGSYWENNGGGGLFMSLVSYDREIFSGVAYLTMAGGCSEPATVVWLAVNNKGYREEISQAYKMITLSQAWRLRVKDSLRATRERAEAFYKGEGEKAIKALRESSVPQKTIVPLQ